MRWRKVVRKPISIDEDGKKVTGGINAVIAANVGESGGHVSQSSKQSIRVVQRGDRTEVTETTSHTESDPS